MAGSTDANDSRLSMREKATRKKRVNEQHQNNYRAGTVPVNERQLHRTGIRGRKIYFLMFLLIALLLLCLINLIILIVVYEALDISYAGMKSLSFEKTGRLKWLLDSDLEYIFPRDGVIGGYIDHNLDFFGENQNVMFQVGVTRNTSSISVGPDGTIVQMKNAYEFVDPVAAKRILKLSKDSSLKVTAMTIGPDLKTPNLRTSRIVSDDDSDLTIAGKDIGLTGNEGIFIDGKTLELSAGQDVEIKSEDAEGEILLDGASGVRLERSKLKDTSSSVDVVSGRAKFRLCACVNNGRLYRLPLTPGSKITCAMAKSNPCL